MSLKGQTEVLTQVPGNVTLFANSLAEIIKFK